MRFEKIAYTIIFFSRLSYLEVVGILLLLFTTGCDLGTNTVDPMASTDINTSKKSNLFVQQYIGGTSNCEFFKFKEAWMEHSWGDTIVNGSVLKQKQNNLQLDFSLQDFFKQNFQDKNYLLDWEMKERSNGNVGKANGVYVLFLKKAIIPDTFSINIYSIKSDRTIDSVCNFVIRKGN